MVEAIPATTENGTGLVLPAAKALAHVMLVHEAIGRGWAITTGDAVLDLEDAYNHIVDATIPDGLMTAEAAGAYHHWAEELTGQLEALRQANDETPVAEAINVDDLKQLAKNAWQLMTVLDRELTGLPIRDTDPGRIP